MKTLIACAQFAAAPGDAAGNIGRMESLSCEAGSLGARIVVFPELCLPGYVSPGEAGDLAIDLDGPEIGRLREAARGAKAALCFGFIERAPGGRLYNSMAFVDPGRGLLAVYRKVHLWQAESEWAAEGGRFDAFDAIGAFDAGPLRCGMWICYDTRFPEAARAVALAGATAALVGSAWFGPAEEWELALRARALDNGIFAAGAALQGSAGGAAFHGASLVVDPHGVVLARAREGRDEVIAAEYDDEAVASFRARLPLLAHRRPGAYA